ncbi:TMV resistance protein N-like [Bidens hawaiensis]|uniref:TMV resistance protein N-like n=1 Tax=Bidens hawaiensis TaxID=980011 RepID=UPI004049557B
MHDLIQEMGWQIACESFPNSRLWKLEDIRDSLKDKQKLEAIEAIVVSDKLYDIEEYEENVSFSADVFVGMKSLRLLDIIGRFTSSKPTFFPDDLRWLRWSHYPFPSLSTSQMNKLVGLEIVGGAIKQLWIGQKVMPNLKFLNLHNLDCITTFPDVSVAPSIGKLVLSSCKNLVEVHESLGSHKRIYRLIIKCCERLKHLPSKFKMESLKLLRLEKCSSLERFPDVSPCMAKLSFISLDSCSSIQVLPSTFGYLSSLVYLSLRRYTGDRMSDIPICKEEHGCEEESFVDQDDTKAFERQPKSISLHTLANLCSLRILNLSCRPMESEVLLKNLQAFSYLENLDLSGNNNLVELPASISQLSHLKRLFLNECHQLQVLHGIPPRMQELEANNCYSLKRIEDLLTEHDRWNHISFINCQKLLGDEDNEKYLDKILQQSFLKRCAVVDDPLTIVIPGNKIPCWFREQPGYLISLMMPPKHNNTQIIGIVVCSVFSGKWHGPPFGFDISVNLEKDGKSIIQKEEVDSCVINKNASDQNGNTWIGYRPCSSIRALQCQDWSGAALLISLHLDSGAKAARCAALLMYKEEEEDNQHISIKTCIGRPWVTRRKMEKRSTSLKRYMNRQK